MCLQYELPVYKESYDLLMERFQFTKEFSKEYKYAVGDSLKKETIDLLTLIFTANAGPTNKWSRRWRGSGQKQLVVAKK